MNDATVLAVAGLLNDRTHSRENSKVRDGRLVSAPDSQSGVPSSSRGLGATVHS